MNRLWAGFLDEMTKSADDPIESALESSEEKQKKEREQKGGRGQAAAVAAAGSAPFAGMIGQERIRHDPTRNRSIKRFGTIDELSRHAKPGDVLITSKPKSVWKTTQAPVFGTEFYHAQPVVGKRGGRGTTASAGNYRDKYYQRLSHKNFKAELETIGKEMAEEGYKDVVLLRPNKPLKGKELKSFVRQNLDRARTEYDTTRAIKAWAKDIFIPKIVPMSALQKMEGTTTIQYRRMKDPDTGKMAKRPVMCKGNVCSTMPAQAFEEATSKAVVRGKLSKDVLPADFLRSKEFSPVGAVVKGTRPMHRLKPLAVRGAMGTGLAGATYAGTENPEIAAAAGGAVAGSMVHKRLAQHIGKKKGLSSKEIQKNLPNLMRAADSVLNAENPKEGRKAFARYLRKSLPAKVLGAGLAYGTAKHLLAKRQARDSASSASISK